LSPSGCPSRSAIRPRNLPSSPSRLSSDTTGRLAAQTRHVRTHTSPLRTRSGMTERFWARRGLYKYAGHVRPCAVDARDARKTDEALKGQINARRPAVRRADRRLTLRPLRRQNRLIGSRRRLNKPRHIHCSPHDDAVGGAVRWLGAERGCAAGCLLDVRVCADRGTSGMAAWATCDLCVLIPGPLVAVR
jgi:hypothetical protein